MKKRTGKPFGSRDNPITAIRAEPLFRQRIVPGKGVKGRKPVNKPEIDLDD